MGLRPRIDRLERKVRRITERRRESDAIPPRCAGKPRSLALRDYCRWLTDRLGRIASKNEPERHSIQATLDALLPLLAGCTDSIEAEGCERRRTEGETSVAEVVDLPRKYRQLPTC